MPIPLTAYLGDYDAEPEFVRIEIVRQEGGLVAEAVWSNGARTAADDIWKDLEIEDAWRAYVLAPERTPDERAAGLDAFVAWMVERTHESHRYDCSDL